MALTTSQLCQTTLGGRHLEAWSITGDGTTTTFNPRVSVVDHAWIQSSTGVTCQLLTSISSGVITMTQHNSSALENGKVYYLFFIGSN